MPSPFPKPGFEAEKVAAFVLRCLAEVRFEMRLVIQNLRRTKPKDVNIVRDPGCWVLSGGGGRRRGS